MKSLPIKMFRYRALDSSGQLCCGEFNATSLEEVEQQLASLGLALISARTMSSFRPLRTGRRLPRSLLISFCFQFGQLLEAGVAPVESLRAIRSTSDTSASGLAADLLRDIENGQSLSVAAAHHPQIFPSGLLALLRAGEASGDLARAWHDIGHSLEHEDEMTRYAQRVAIYPFILVTLLLLTLTVALTTVVPELEKLFRSNQLELPWQTRSLLTLSDFTLKYGIHTLVGCVLLITTGVLSFCFLPTARIHGDAWLLRLPVLGPLLNKIALARITSMLARLYTAGINLLDALELAAHATGNRVLQAGVLGARARIEQGQGLSAAFAAEALFPPLVETMLSVGEHSGRLDEALSKLTKLYQRDIAHAVSRLQALLEPLLTIVLGLLLLWIASAVLGPVYDLITRMPT